MAQPVAKRDEAALSTGEVVRAFYHMNDHPNGFRYVRVLSSPPEGTPESVASIGLSTGWIPATVMEDWSPGQESSGKDGRVLVKLHGHFTDVYNLDPEPVKGMYWRVSRSLVRPTSPGHDKVKAKPLELSLLVVRWWDYWNRNNKRSRTHNVANEEMLLDVLEGPHSPHAEFGERGGYEVISAFVRGTEDLEAIGSTLTQAMRGQHKAGLYFLWPTQRPTVEKKQAGCVSEPALFSLLKRMEGLGVKSCWPHDGKLWRELSGKLWVPRVSRGRPELRVPPTVMVDLERWQSEPEKTIKDILLELRGIGEQAQKDVPDASFRGVVKLGFSWMGDDVLPFTGPTELWKALTTLLEGAQPGAICLVQKRVEAVVCELRMVCSRDLAAGPEAVKMELARMQLKPKGGSTYNRHSDETFALTSHKTMTEAEARDQCFKGNAKALQAAESEVRRLAALWLAWLREEGFGVPDSCRLDFLVAEPQGSSGMPEVWTVELCECGGALCDYTHHARTASTLNACCSDAKGAERPPKPIPALTLVERPAADASTSSRGAVRPRGVAPKDGVVARLFGGASNLKIGAILAVLVMLFLRLRRRS